MLTLHWFRLSALLAVLVAVLSLGAVGTAEARFGGSFGTRGYRTYQTIPATPSAPGITGAVQKSGYPAGATRPGGYSAPFARPGFFNGLGGWLFGGLLFSGLFGMMFGAGFGGFGGVLSLIVQILVISFIVRLIFRRRMQPMGGPSQYWGPAPGHGGSQEQPRPSTAPRSHASQRAGRRDEIGLGDRDLAVFEQRLGQLQDAFAREDRTALGAITTAEVLGHLNDELAQNAARGLRNEVFDVRLLNGDIAEAWREGMSDYATVAMHYESRDVMRDRKTGAVVSGDDRIAERREVWTFVRHHGGGWVISAIQGA